MQRQLALEHLKRILPELRNRYGVKDLAIFGSTVRDEAGPASDLDILVEFEGKADFDRFMGLKLYLEDLLAMPVDLVTGKALRPEMKPRIEREAVHVS